MLEDGTKVEVDWKWKDGGINDFYSSSVLCTYNKIECIEAE